MRFERTDEGSLVSETVDILNLRVTDKSAENEKARDGLRSLTGVRALGPRRISHR
jgi:hypothetical protein